jgi:uncharacterized protein DUF1553/uncharacterized protein DUF1549
MSLTTRTALWLTICTGLAGAIGVRADSDPFTPTQRALWSIQPVRTPTPPRVTHRRWVRTPIDAFVMADLEKAGIAPASRADKITLLRRASLDLIGLPPTPEDVAAFLADKSANAFDKVIDRLLASPQYGERWARHWLDLARYAESEGFKADETRPNAWRYRDYVIKAFNTDKPYDRFLMEQLAGDELWPDDFDARVATAFNRHYPDESNARNLMQRRQEILNDITDTVGATFLGLTVGCARCHDHKFDPILQADYYRLQAFFANVRAADDVLLVPQPQAELHRARFAEWEAQTRDVRERIAAVEAPKRQEIERELIEKYPEAIQAAIKKPGDERTPIEWQMFHKAKTYLDPKSHAYVASSRIVGGQLKGETRKQWDALQAELKTFDRLNPGELPMATAIVDANRTAPTTFTLYGGAYDAPVDEVQPGFLTILDSKPAAIEPLPAGVESTGRRATLARWLVNPSNPLTARVMVNRIWHYHFGRGLAASPSNFGISGERPTNPALLDWMAAEFARSGWSMKAMHRLIMRSSVYQQSSAWRAEAGKIDSGNRLWWRFPRQRLEGEVIRDSALAVAGVLNTTFGGPSVFPDVPPGMESRGGWKVSERPEDRNRRSIYVFVRRNTRYPLFEAFDMPDTHESCARRDVTTSPLQALMMLNSSMTIEWARAFAGRVLKQAGEDPIAQIDAAYQLAYSRRPRAAERASALDFFNRHRAILENRTAAGGKLSVPAERPPTVTETAAATLVDFCHMLLNSNEFVHSN